MSDALFGPWISEGLHAELSKCSTCKITHTVQLTNQDSATGALGQKFSSALLSAPDVNAVAVPLDPWFLIGISQGIQSSGRADKLEVIGAFGQQANIDLVRGGQAEDATVAYDQTWEGWSGVDTALRVLAGQRVLPAGIGLQAVDRDHNLPGAGAAFTYVPQIDFKQLYHSVWKQG
jgi:ribose transport system substrate-binding protein